MAKIIPDSTESVSAEVLPELVYVSLQKFADDNALKYGIELMGGFFHTQESSNTFADTEENYRLAIQAFAKKEVK
jgi:hypothetical protein